MICCGLGTSPHKSQASKRMEGLNALGKLQTEDAEKFVHRAINGICDKEGLHYEDFAKLLSLADFTKLRHSLTAAIRQLARAGVKKQEISDKLVGSGLSAELCQLVSECMWVRREELRSQLVRDSCAISHSHLEDFDWRVKLIMSSDKLGSIQQPVLSLDFDLRENRERRTESVELSREELEQLITSLEAANKVVTQLRT